jgi:hypothetical protein
MALMTSSKELPIMLEKLVAEPLLASILNKDKAIAEQF